MKIGFDNEKYLKMQSQHKLYLEFGGKLFDDFHASRVLPDLNPTASCECSCSSVTRQKL